MSYTKERLMDEAIHRAMREMNLATVHAEMSALERIHQRERLERLAWEAKRATEDYLAALTEYENDRNDDAGRRADEQIAAGQPPF